MNSIKKDLYYKIMKLLAPIVRKKLMETNNECISDYDFEKSIKTSYDNIVQEAYKMIEEHKFLGIETSFDMAYSVCEKKRELQMLENKIVIDFDNLWESLENVPEEVRKRSQNDIKSEFFETRDIYLNSPASDFISENNQNDNRRTYPALDIVTYMQQKYPLLGKMCRLQTLMYREKRLNDIRIVALLPNVYRNVENIIEDMEKFGYFVSYREDRTDSLNFKWTSIAFEPYQPKDSTYYN